MGDVIIWDNRFLPHSSGRNPGPEQETMMYRITMKDGMPLCAPPDCSRRNSGLIASTYRLVHHSAQTHGDGHVLNCSN